MQIDVRSTEIHQTKVEVIFRPKKSNENYYFSEIFDFFENRSNFGMPDFGAPSIDSDNFWFEAN